MGSNSRAVDSLKSTTAAKFQLKNTECPFFANNAKTLVENVDFHTLILERDHKKNDGTLDAYKKEIAGDLSRVTKSLESVAEAVADVVLANQETAGLLNKAAQIHKDSAKE